VAGGTIRYPELHELAVLGGTRLYGNARGAPTVIRTTCKPRRDILLLRLTGVRTFLRERELITTTQHPLGGVSARSSGLRAPL
jgi:hypothetical protein